MFWTSVWNVVYIYLVNVPAMISLSVIIAVVLNSPHQRLKDFFRITYLIPYVTSVLSIAIVFFVRLRRFEGPGEPASRPHRPRPGALAHIEEDVEDFDRYPGDVEVDWATT